MRHYLDHNATAPLRPEVLALMQEVLGETGNPLSVHDEGRRANARVETAREQIRALINAPVNGVIFTSGGTEAAHLALHGARDGLGLRRIFVSAIEHVCVHACAEQTGCMIETVPATPHGQVDLHWLADRLSSYDSERDGRFLLCVMYANNETGVLQPVAEAAQLAHAAGGYVFCDAAQAIGKVPVNFVMSGADLMSITAHKFGGPIGVGALIASPGLPVAPQLRGGGQEMNRRAGTSNVAAIAGFGAACEHAKTDDAQAIASLRDEAERALAQEGVKIWGAAAARLPGTLCLSADGFDSATQLMTMDLAGVAISAGSACSSGKTTPSHVLRAMGASDAQAGSAIRMSLGWNSTRQDVDAFVEHWKTAYERIKSRAA